MSKWIFLTSIFQGLIFRHFCEINRKGVYFYSHKIREITVVKPELRGHLWDKEKVIL
jgi:hypothetical protein